MTKIFHVYILASEKNGTLYVGVTSDLVTRVYAHRTHADPKSFTAIHDVTKLVYFEHYDDAENAIRREKRIKRWKREWKMNIIERENPDWDDLYEGLV